MSIIAGFASSAARDKLQDAGAVKAVKRKFMNDCAVENISVITTLPPNPCTSTKWKSPRRCINGSPKMNEGSSEKLAKACKSPVKRLSDSFLEKTKWNPGDMEQLRLVKEALHVSSAPSMIACRDDEQKRVLEFCKQCIKQKKAGSLYMSGCPGTGKSLSIERVKRSLVNWAKEAGFQPPDVLAINCTTLPNTPEIFNKILGKILPQRKFKSATSPLQHLQKLYSRKQQSNSMKMTLIIADELDYLITKDRAVLHDLFMLVTLPVSRCILIGIANAIDLTDRFLRGLQSLNCKPMVLTFRAYTKDQIISILQQRLMELPYNVFQAQALELCARKVAAASGDMRKVLCICRSAIEMLEAELMQSKHNLDLSFAGNGYSDNWISPDIDPIKQEIDMVMIDHMAVALSKTYGSPIVETIQSLPQHQQIVLCSAVKLFRGGKKDTTIGELSKSYLDICKFTLIPPVGVLEFSSMCIVLGDQGVLKVGQAREDKLRRITLKVDESDVAGSSSLQKLSQVVMDRKL